MVMIAQNLTNKNRILFDNRKGFIMNNKKFLQIFIVILLLFVVFNFHLIAFEDQSFIGYFGNMRIFSGCIYGLCML